MLERQREGVAKAKAEGKYRGSRANGAAEGRRRGPAAGRGVKPESIAEKLGISLASVFRVLKDQRGH